MSAEPAAGRDARTKFDRDTSVVPLGPAQPGRYAVEVSGDWSAPNGPNGGYLAAILLRALEAELDDPTRPPRALTLHYLRPPATGASADVVVDVERSGRSVTTATLRMEQEGRLCVLGVVSCSGPQPSAADYATAMPDVPPAAAVEPSGRHPDMPEIAHRFELRPCLGGPMFSSADEAVSGGWIRLSESEPLTCAVIALLVDAWLPVPWVRLDAPVPAPTLDLTIHFRATAHHERIAPGEPVLARFVSTTSGEGFSEEDCEIWAPDGTLLAQGRQLALLRPGSVPGHELLTG